MISAPSGVGKTTLIRPILTKIPFLRFSVSCTTRSPRAGEIPARDYHFLTGNEFRQGIEARRFLEWAQVHGEYYGTDGDQVDRWLGEGLDVLLDIDVQGARQVRCRHPSCRTIFILPPSMDALEERLRNRGTESPEQLAKRLEAAHREIREAPWYDFIIVNDVLSDAMADLEAIFRANRCRLLFQGWRIPLFTSGDTP